MTRVTKKQYVEVAKVLYHDEGTVEIDDKPSISRSTDGGAYVAAWVWVSDSDVQNIL